MATRKARLTTYLPKPGDVVRVLAISSSDHDPSFGVGAVLMCKLDQAWPPKLVSKSGFAKASHRTWVYLEAVGQDPRAEQYGAYCRVRPATESEEAAWRLLGDPVYYAQEE